MQYIVTHHNPMHATTFCRDAGSVKSVLGLARISGGAGLKGDRGEGEGKGKGNQAEGFSMLGWG